MFSIFTSTCQRLALSQIKRRKFERFVMRHERIYKNKNMELLLIIAFSILLLQSLMLW